MSPVRNSKKLSVLSTNYVYKILLYSSTKKPSVIKVFQFFFRSRTSRTKLPHAFTIQLFIIKVTKLNKKRVINITFRVISIGTVYYWILLWPRVIDGSLAIQLLIRKFNKLEEFHLNFALINIRSAIKVWLHGRA